MINHSLYTDQSTPNTLCTILFINFRSIFIRTCTLKMANIEIYSRDSSAVRNKK